MSYAFRFTPAGTSAVHFSSCPTTTSLAISVSSESAPPSIARVIFDPGTPVPEIVWSPAVGAITSGCLLFSATGTSISLLPPSRSLSVTVTVIGPVTSVPGVTSISPVSLLITDGTLFSSLSLAETVVVSSGFVTTIPVPCF